MVFWPQLWFNESKQRLRGLPFVRCDSPGLLLLTRKKWDTVEHDRIVDTIVKLGKTLSDWGTGMSWLHFDRDLKYSIFSGIPKNGMDDHDEAYNTYSNYNIYIYYCERKHACSGLFPRRHPRPNWATTSNAVRLSVATPHRQAKRDFSQDLTPIHIGQNFFWPKSTEVSLTPG